MSRLFMYGTRLQEFEQIVMNIGITKTTNHRDDNKATFFDRLCSAYKPKQAI